MSDQKEQASTTPPPASKSGATAVAEEDERVPLTLSWENYTVHVPTSKLKSKMWSKDNPLTYFMRDYLGASVEPVDSFYALDNVSGYVRSGEMCLILGTNDMASSTLLRGLSQRLSTQEQVTGTTLINGIPLTEAVSQKWRRRMPYCSPEDTTHSAVLTVKETLEFAAQCTNPDASIIQEKVDNLMALLDLSHVKDTVVGDENLRGISGGQKRRVTVGEMMTDPTCRVLSLDHITDGLSSKDSMHLLSSLKKGCEDFEVSCVIALSQPSDEIVALFENILVLTDHGEQVYFGPPDRSLLRKVFLGTDDSSQDKGSICDLVLSTSVQEQADAVHKRYLATSSHRDMLTTLSDIRAAAPPARERDITPFLPKKKYANSFARQFVVLANRRRKLIFRNAVTYTRICIAILFGLIIGSLFSEINNDLIGSLGRTGYLFLHCFLVLMLSAAITIPQTFRDRLTLFKHRSAEFYSGRVAYVTQVLLDIPLSVFEAIILSVISYRWVNLRNDTPARFLYFMGTLIGLEFVGQAFGRLLCAICRKQVYANTLSSVFILMFGTVAGFMPNYLAIPGVLRWLSWVTPASYAFEGIMINEFFGRTIDTVPVSGTGGPTVPGMPGQAWLDTYALPRAGFAEAETMQIFDIFMLFGLALTFDLMGWYMVEHCRDWYFMKVRRSTPITKSFGFSESLTKQFGVPKVTLPLAGGGDKAKAQADNKESTSFSSDKEDVEQNTIEEVGASDTTSPLLDVTSTLSARNLSYFVPMPGKHKPKRFSMKALLGPVLARMSRATVRSAGASLRTSSTSDVGDEPQKSSPELQLLHGINCRFESGRICALMGTSGAGKTTLLDVLAGYKNTGKIDGEVSNMSRRGYAEQNDILNPYLSVAETLSFTAACILREDDKSREAVVKDTMELMGLTEMADSVVGNEADGEGLPKHARKRLTIAVQLVTKPRVLFTDEPTTGLGTSAANLVMTALRRCTDEMGLITLATIHQPSVTIWEKFDDLLLLVKGGRLAYMGPIGPNSSTLLNHFSTLSGITPPPQVNPADFVLSAVAGEPIDKVVKAYLDSDVRKQIDTLLDSDFDTTKQTSDSTSEDSHPRQNSYIQQFSLLTKRHLITQWRNPSYSFMRIFSSIFASLYMGILFIGDKSEITSAVSTIGAIFFLVFVLVIPMQASVVPLIEDRAVLYREATAGLYSRWAYGFGQLAADIPFHLLNAELMLFCFYFIADFRREGEQIGYFMLVIFLSNWVIMSLGQLYATVTPNEESANGLAGLSIILSVILMGFLIMYSAMPSYWQWAYWSNLFHYIIQGLVTNELGGKIFKIYLFGPPESSPDALAFNVNETNAPSYAFILDPRTDTSPGSNEQQSLAFLNLALEAGPGINELGGGGIEALSDLVQCMVEYECMAGDDLISDFMTCCILPSGLPPKPPPCRNEFNMVTETIDIQGVAQCFIEHGGFDDSGGIEEDSNSDQARGVPIGVSMDDFNLLSENSRLQLVLCLMRTLMPETIDRIKDIILEIIGKLFDFFMGIIDLLERLAGGIPIPGEIILFVFGWAEREDGEFVTFKWHYCLTAMAAFLVGIEILKLFSVRYVVFTKR